MAEVLAEFSDPIVSADGTAYCAQAVGAPASNGLWEGWIEFIPVAGGASLRSARETTQPNRRDAAYWATGLTRVFLEGALDRATRPLVRQVRPAAEPRFDGPAPSGVRTMAGDAPLNGAVLDPFSVFEKGESLLRKELGALDPWHLVNIVVAYRLSDNSVTTLNRQPAASLIETIVAGVRAGSPLSR